MKKEMFRFASAVVALGFGVTAQAGFVNGGFEANNFSGWTVQHGINYGGLNGSGVVWDAGSPDAIIVGAAYNDPYSPFDAPFNGSYMARLNDFANGAEATRISQTGIMAAGETDVYINWGAVMEDPNHADPDEPQFLITINKNGSFFAGENHNANQGGWTAGGAGPNGSQIYYSSGVFHVSGLAIGDQVEVILTVLDCALTGHSGWAYLDGIGTVQQTPPPGVPDGGATLALLTPAFLGLVALRRKR